MSKENQITISEWSLKTFNSFASKQKLKNIEPIGKKLKEETFELFELLNNPVDLNCDEIEKYKTECADVYIVLVQLATALGFSLQDAVDAKMKKNRRRKWEKVDGTYRHVS